MSFVFAKALDQAIADRWRALDLTYKKAFAWVAFVNVLAFGFEMTNVTLHHDDVAQIFIEDSILGYYVGRFGLGWLHRYTQGAYLMPFLQMVLGILFMSLYGLVVARLWDVRTVWGVVLVAAVLAVFPYMAQIYQYNTAMATYSLAHLLVALGAILATRATVLNIAVASVLVTAALSIYQGVIANAATILVFWLLSRALAGSGRPQFWSRATGKALSGAVAAIVVGGVIYMVALSIMDVKLGSYQAADEALSLSGSRSILDRVDQVIQGSRAFFAWPENYFPAILKKIQLAFLLVGFALCLWLPRRWSLKLVALGLLAAGLFAPRLLQLVHPAGTYHSLTLTAYALVVAGCVMIVLRWESIIVRNAASLLALLLIAGYILQCNWISTVNYLNTQAHMSTFTQVLARIRAFPSERWDGKTIAVVGRYNMPSTYPYLGATGVATKYLDAVHMQHLSKLMRDEAVFLSEDEAPAGIKEFAASHREWPHPSSVGIVDGMGVVVFSRGERKGLGDG